MLDTSMSSKSSNGSKLAYEDVGCAFLTQNNLILIHRNFSWKGGEVDGIFLDGKELVFVEMKYRKHSDFGTPLERITKSQIRRIHQTALIFLETNPEYERHYYRFDALGLSPWCGNSKARTQRIQSSNHCQSQHSTFQGMAIEWILNAF